MSCNRVDGLYLAAIPRRIAHIDQPTTGYAVDVRCQLVRRQHEFGAGIGAELCCLGGHRTRFECAACHEPGRESAIQQACSLMPEPSQHPPRSGSESPVTTVIDNDIILVADAQSPECLGNRGHVGKWMAAGQRASRRRKILIEIEENRAGDMPLFVTATTRCRIGQVEPCVHEGNASLADQRLEFVDGHQYLLGHRVPRSWHRRLQALYATLRFETIAAPRGHSPPYS